MTLTAPAVAAIDGRGRVLGLRARIGLLPPGDALVQLAKRKPKQGGRVAEVGPGRLDARDWSPFQEERHVSFTDLPAGKHYFQVRAMDRNTLTAG